MNRDILLASALRPVLPVMTMGVPVAVPYPYSETMTGPPAGNGSAPGVGLLVVSPVPQAHSPASEPQATAASTAQTEPKAKDPVDRILARMDIDRDGRISPREARGLWLELFTRLDRNNDGYLDRNELAAALKQYPGLQSKT
jgi:hypothetical protein